MIILYVSHTGLEGKEISLTSIDFNIHAEVLVQTIYIKKKPIEKSKSPRTFGFKMANVKMRAVNALFYDKEVLGQ